MNTTAVVLNAPGALSLNKLELTAPTEDDIVVAVAWSGISTGTERLLWSGRMPSFPGMGYPLVPGYESVGRVLEAGSRANARAGDHVFVPGAKCFGGVRGLFGGAASRLVVPAARTLRIDEGLGESGVLLALAATAHHAIVRGLPDLIVGHGVLGRLIARLVVQAGGAPVVWERNPDRAQDARGYEVRAPENDLRRDYSRVCDVSGDSTILDQLVARLAPGGEIVLAGFYSDALSFAFAPAFMRETTIRIAAQWLESDLSAANNLIADGKLALDGLITHRCDANDADAAYRTAFEDPACLKMILDWRAYA